MNTAQPPTWRSLEALRGVAALLVMALHALHAAPSVYGSPALLDRWVLASFVWGWIGVPVFFVLSGFVLTLPWLAADGAAAAPAWKPYLARRAARVLPAFWLQLALVALGLALLGDFPGASTGASLTHWPWQLGMGFYLDPAIRPWLSVWWTLPVELSFYVVLPWLLARRPRQRVRWLAGLILGAIVLRGVAGAGGTPTAWALALAFHLPTRIDAFLLGVVAALLWHSRGAAVSAARACGLMAFGSLLALGSIVLVTWVQAPLPERLPEQLWLAPWHSVFALGVAALVLGLTGWERQRRLPGWSAPLVALGRVSYGVYLWHLPVLAALVAAAAVAGVTPWPPTLLLAALPPTVLLAWASWRWIEEPARAWVRRRWPYTTSPAAG